MTATTDRARGTAPTPIPEGTNRRGTSHLAATTDRIEAIARTGSRPGLLRTGRRGRTPIRPETRGQAPDPTRIPARRRGAETRSPNRTRIRNRRLATLVRTKGKGRVRIRGDAPRQVPDPSRGRAPKRDRATASDRSTRAPGVGRGLASCRRTGWGLTPEGSTARDRRDRDPARGWDHRAGFPRPPLRIRPGSAQVEGSEATKPPRGTSTRNTPRRRPEPPEKLGWRF